jgi:opacity protein-like surface antigen
MKRSLAVTALLTLLLSSTLAAQRPAVTPPPRNWVSPYVTMFTNMSDFDDPDSQSRWMFDDSGFGVGLSLMREFGQSLVIGIDASGSRTNYERRAIGTNTGTPLASGSATVGTAMLTGRFASGGRTELGFYLTGGLGTVAYKLEDLDGWNADFGLRAGTGLEYRYSTRGTVFLEWGRLWGYHEKEGVSGGRVNHSALKLGGRFGF